MLVQPLPEELWLSLEPLLPPPRGRRNAVLSDRRALEGLVFILRTGMSRNALPPQLFCGSPAMLWRRLRRWQSHGHWAAVQALLRDRLPDGAQLKWERLDRDEPRGCSVG